MKSSKTFAMTVLCAGSVSLAQTTPQQPPSRQKQRSNATSGPVNNNAAVQAGALMRRSNGSLLQAQLAAQSDPAQVKPAQISFLAIPEPEPKTLRRHDLVTIVIREQSEIQSKATKDFNKQATFDAKVDQFVKFGLKGPFLTGNPTPTNPIEAKLEGQRQFQGQGDLDRTDSFTARITAEVVDVKPNGTIVLQARKRIKTDEEQQQFILTGTCRVEDITADNTVLSTQLYDLELQKNHTGDVKNATDRGLLPKLLDAINPF